jgi:hypothetical protein
MENVLVKIIVAAAMGEAVVQTLKMVWEKKTLTNGKGKFNPDKLIVLAVGILIAFGASLDLFAIVGIPMNIPYLGIILTGILISRGEGFVHDLLAYIKSLKEILLTKAHTANNERNGTALTLDPNNLPDGTKVNITTGPGVIDKAKDMVGNIAGKMDRVVKVIRSSPEVKTEEAPAEQPVPVDGPPDEVPINETGVPENVESPPESDKIEETNTPQ